MTLLQANLHKIRDKSALCAKKLSLKILLKINLRLRACLAMCLKYGKTQPKRANKARAYKIKKCICLWTDVRMNPLIEMRGRI